MKPAARAAAAAAVVLAVPLTAVVTLAIAGSMAAPAAGLPDPGALTRWGLPVTRAVHDVAATFTVGLLVLAVTVLPAGSGPDAEGLGRARGRAVILAGASASVWSVAGAVFLALTYSDVAGINALSVRADEIAHFVLDLELGRALALSATLAAFTASGCWLATRMRTVAVLAVSAVAALLPLTVTGHGASNHEAAVNLLGMHLIGATVWVGGLAGLVTLRAVLGEDVVLAACRYSRLAGWGFVLVLVSGVAGAALRLEGWEALNSPYGLLLALKTVALGLLGFAGWHQRVRGLSALRRDPASGGAFARLATIELAVMAVTVGVAVALSRTSPFAFARVETAAESLLGYAMPPLLTAEQWFTQWRVDVVWTTVGLLLGAWYLKAVLRLRRRGQSWPVSRCAAWLGACAALIWATSGAPAVYGRVLLSMQVVSIMTLALTVPVLMALGSPFVLAARTLPVRTDGSMGRREWIGAASSSAMARRLTRPGTAAVLYGTALTTYWFSPALTGSLASNSGRLLTIGAALVIGFLVASSLLASAPVWGSSARRRLVVVATLMGVNCVVAVAVMTVPVPVGGDWYPLVQQLWPIPIRNDRIHAGLLLWGTGSYPMAILATAVARQRPIRVHGATIHPAGSPSAVRTDAQKDGGA